MSDIENAKGEGQRRISRRRLLQIGAGLGALALVGRGTYEALDKDETVRDIELGALDKVVSTFTNQETEPEFWKNLRGVTSGMKNASKNIDIVRGSTREDKSTNVIIFYYYSDGAKEGQPNLYLLIIEPDGKTYPSAVVLTNLQLGKSGLLAERNRDSLNIPLQLDDIKQKAGQYFKEPDSIQGTVWRDTKNRWDTRTGQLIQSLARNHEDGAGFKYRQQVDQRGSMELTVWYPPTQNSPLFMTP